MLSPSITFEYTFLKEFVPLNCISKNYNEVYDKHTSGKCDCIYLTPMDISYQTLEIRFFMMNIKRETMNLILQDLL